MSSINLKTLRQHLADDEHRYRFQIVLIPLLFSAIAFTMSVLNYFTGEYMLMSVTFVFSILSTLCSLLSYFNRNLVELSYGIFNAILLLMCVFFIINGGADGFSILWVIMLPACGLTFSGIKKGTIHCAILFAVMIFLLWTPFGQSLLQYEYSSTFILRFPLLFAACYFIGLFFETARKITYDSLKETQEKLWLLSVKDGMTGINNHAKFTQDLDALLNDEEEHTAGFIYVDINGLKQVNDTQSHDVGDRMIYSCVKVLTDRFPSDICYRMGGDEFIVFLRDCSAEEFDNHLRLIREDYSKTSAVSVAVGGAYAENSSQIRNSVIKADSDMQSIKTAYYKQSGLDRRK